MALWFWQAVIPESGGVIAPWVVRHVVGCRLMAIGMALWFWQAVIPESGGLFGPWLARHVFGGRPNELAMALWFWQALIPESAGLLPPGALSDWSLSGELVASGAAPGLLGAEVLVDPVSSGAAV
ncbi:hypothetical protein [Mycobacterium sp. RTGN5]|uniref:hypothetical protein n=1 Tax=Mycobacterium sp. RTGN5 TaxID=3016522 RepID=UPI0029C7813C|nr:hypothetical protein [Mycobacterium sp. RTGN5]